ncbi:MAG: protein kinase [Myxococcales bacterium]|nr:protein kinase [Myxococcales bacterium]
MNDVGTIAERFETEALAGSGGMGSVYRARDRLTGGLVALKLMTSAPKNDWRFEREAELVAQLTHPGIVRHVAHGRLDDGRLWLALEWLEGEDLEARLGGRGLTMRESLVLARRVAEALGAAHSVGVVHRDVKPGNIFLVDRDPLRPKLLDFGVARVVGAKATRTGSALGTPAYMSPEQARGERDVDARADVWSLGGVLFECLTGSPPFTGDHPMAILGKIVIARAPLVTELRPEVPIAVTELVARMLSRERDGRPPSGNAAAVEIAELGELGVPDRTTRSARRPSLTATEQRLLGVIMADSWQGRDVDLATAPTLSPGQMDEALSRARTIASGFGGHLEAVAANSVIVTFTVGGTAVEQATRAARCALALRSALPEMRFAVSLGLGVMAAMSASGEVIDRAAALLRALHTLSARGSPIALDSAAAGLLDAAFEIETRGEVRLLVAEHDALEVARTLLGRPTPCLGRDNEIRTLCDVLEESIGDPGARLALVTGAAGLGKSRVVSELGRVARARDVDVWVARGDPMSAGAPYALASRALRRAARALDAEPPEGQRDKLVARVARRVPAADVARVSTFLGEMTGILFDADPSVELLAARRDPKLLGDQIARAWVDLFRAEALSGPILLVLDDLHWGDLGSLSLALSLATSLPESPIFTVLLGRPEVFEVFPRLREARDVVELPLRKLSKKACVELARDALGPGVPEARVSLLVNHADGNALYLEELIRAQASGADSDVPETVLAMVGARLEALEPEARRVLRACSVFGETFWPEGVRRLLGARHTDDGGEWLRELCSRELVLRQPSTKLGGREEYAFRHSLLREAAYRMLTPEDRALGHRLAAEWLSENGESNALVLAEHWDQGNEAERAMSLYLRAAEQALAGNDFPRVLSCTERARVMGATGDLLGQLAMIECDVLDWQGEHAEASLRAAAAALAFTPGSVGEIHARLEAGLHESRIGKLDGLIAAVERLPQFPEADRDTRVALTLARAVSQLLRAGRMELVRSVVESLEAAQAERKNDPMYEYAVQLGAAWVALFAGDIAASLAHDEAAVVAAERAGNLRIACKQRADAGYERLLLGDYAGALELFVTSLDQAQTMGLEPVRLECLHNGGLALCRLGRLDEAVDFEQRAVEGYAKVKDWRLQGASHCYLSIIQLERGDAAAAEVEARMGSGLMSEVPATHGFGLACLAQVLLARGKNVEALDVAERGRAELEVAGQVEDGGQLIRLAIAEALAANGKQPEANAAIRFAKDTLLAHAERIQDAESRRSFLERVPENARTLELARAWLAPSEQ